MSKDQVSSRAVFQPVLDMSKFMEAEAAKKVEVLTRAFVSLNKAQSSISRGNNLNDYWNTQRSSIESVVSALEKFEKRQSGFGSMGYAADFLKSYNSFIALGGQKSDVIAAYGSEFDALISKAQKLAPLVAEAFAPDTLKEAFRSFELMKELGVDLTDTFSALKAGSPDEINKALAEMNGRLIEAESRAERAEEALSSFGSSSTIDQLKTKLETLSNLQQNVKDEFDQFLSRSGLGNMIDSSELEDYYESLASGYRTPMEVISRFREEYHMLIAQVGQADIGVTNGEFETFASTLQRITDEMAGLRSEMTDMRAAMSGLGGGGGGEVAQGLATELSKSVELSEAQKQAMAELAGSGDQLHTVIDVLAELIRTSGDAQTNLTGLSESVARMVESLSSLGSVEGDKLASIATALRAISDIGNAQFDTKGINQLGPALSELGKVQNTATLQALTGVNLKGFNELHISKASLKNLADYLPEISTANVDVIQKLANIDFTKLKELKVSKSAVDNIKELFGITDQLNEAKRQIAEALGTADTGNAARVGDIAKRAEDVADAEQRETDAAKDAADAEKRAAEVALDAAIAKQEKADAAGKVAEAERNEAEAAVQTSGAEAAAAQAATDASGAKQAESAATVEAVAAKQANAKAATEEAEAIQKVADAERAEQAASGSSTPGTPMFRSKTQELEEMREALESLYQSFNDDQYLSEHEDMLDKIMAAYKGIEAAMKRIELYGDSKTDIRGIRNTIDNIEQEANTYRKSADEARAAAAEKAEAAAQAAAKVQAEAEKEARAVEASNRKLIASQEKAITAAYQKAEKGFSGDERFHQISELYAEYEKVLAGTGYKKGIVSNEDVAKLNALRSELMALINALGQSESAHDEHAAATKRDAQEAERQTDVIKRQTANLRTSITRMFQSIPGLEDSEYGARLKEIRQELLDPDIDTSKYRELSAEVARLRSEFTEAGYAGSGFFGTLTMGVRNIAGFQVMLAGIRKVTSAIKKMTDAIKETDAAMTELKKVTDLTATGYEQFFKRATEASRNLGATVSDTINATADFARLGYDIDESLELAQAALTYKNVGDGIDTVAQATESIISTIKAFRLEASNAMRVVDEFNEVGNKFAISSTGIGDALVRSASALQGAGNSLEESIGLITAANAIVQNPESVGTSLKTLTMFLRAAKLDLEAAGEDAEGCANSVAELREKLLELTKVDIMVDDSTFKSTYKIIQEISKEWDKLADVDKAAVTKLIGGKRNSNVVQALITNFQDAEKVVETASNAMGSATAENEEYLNSIAGKLDILKGNFEALSEAVVNSRIVKFCVDVLNVITQIATAIGGLPAVLKAPITMFVLVAETITMWSKLGGVISKAFDALKAGSLTALTNPLSLTVLSITAVIGAIVSWKDHVRKAREETIEAANESAKAFRDTTNSYTDGLDKLDKLESRFKTLSKGVDENGKNVSLTADEYAEYKDIIQQIVDISPSIVQGYDAEKNMMLNYKDAINEARGALENLHKEESEEYFATGADRLKGWRNEWKDANDALDKHSGMFMQFAFSDIAEDESRYVEYYALILDKLAEFNVLSKERVESLKDDALAYGALYLNTDDLKALYDNAAAVKSALASITFTDFDGKEVHLFDQNAIQTDYNLIINLGNAIKNERETVDKLFEDIKLYVGEQEIFKSVGDAPWLSSYYEQIKTLANEQLEAGDAAMSWADMQIAAVNTLKHAYSVFSDSDLVRDMQKDAEEYLDGAISPKEYEERLEQFEWALGLANSFDTEGFGNEDDDAVFAIIISYFERILSMSPKVDEAVDAATAKLTGFSDALKRITDGRSILEKATKEMEESGGLSGETIDSIRNALTDGEKLSDYLYEEADAVKLDTEAWNERNKSLARTDLSIYEKRLSDARSELMELENVFPDESSRIQELRQTIKELEIEIASYKAALSVDDVEDPLNLTEMLSNIDNVKKDASGLVDALSGAKNGVLQDMQELAVKYPELMDISGLMSTDSLEKQAAGIERVLKAYQDQYDAILKVRYDALSKLRLEAEAEGEDTGAIGTLMNNIKAMMDFSFLDVDIDKEDPFEKLSKSLSKVSSYKDILRDMQDGIDFDLIVKVRDLLGEDWGDVMLTDGEDYVGIDTDKLHDILVTELDLDGANANLKSSFEKMWAAALKGDNVETQFEKISNAISKASSSASLLSSYLSGDGMSWEFLEKMRNTLGEDYTKYVIKDEGGLAKGLNYKRLRRDMLRELMKGGADQSEIAAFNKYWASIIKGNPFEDMTKSLQGVSSYVSIIKDAQDGIDFDLIVKVRDLLGEDWASAFEFDEAGNPISLNTQALHDLLVVQLDLEGENANLKQAFEEMWNAALKGEEVKTLFEEISDSMQAASSRMDLVSDYLNGDGITWDFVEKVRNTLGEEADKYLIKENGIITDFDHELLRVNTRAELVKNGAGVGLLTLFDQMWPVAEKAASGLEKLSTALSDVSNAQSLLASDLSGELGVTDLLDKLRSFSESSGIDMTELVMIDEGRVKLNRDRVEQYIAESLDVNALVEKYGLTKVQAVAISLEVKNAVEVESELDKISKAVSKVSSAASLLANIRSGNGDFFSMFQTAMEMADETGKSFEDFFDGTKGELGWSEQAVIEYANTWIDNLGEVDGVTAETKEYMRQLLQEQLEVASSAEIASTALGNVTGSLEGVANLGVNAGVGYEQFKSLIEISTDYASAIEYNNGKMTINRDRYHEVTAAVIEQNRAEVENLKYAILLGDEYKTLTENLEKYGKLSNDDQKRLDSLNAEIMAYDVLTNEINNAASAYKRFMSADTSVHSDQYEAAQKAWQVIQDTLYNTDSEMYGMVGREQYQEAVEFLIRPEIDDDDARKTLDRYFSDAKEGADNFVDDLITNGFVDEAGNIGTTANEIADTLGLTIDGVLAMIAEVNQSLDEDHQLKVKIAYTEEDVADLEGRIDGIKQAISDLKEGKIDINSDEGKQKLSEIDGEILNVAGHLDEINRYGAGDLDLSAIETGLAGVRSDVDELKQSIPTKETSKAEIDTTEADQALDTTTSKVEGLGSAIDGIADHPVRIDTNSAESAIARVSTAISGIITKLNQINGQVFSFSIRQNGSAPRVTGGGNSGNIDSGDTQVSGTSMATGFIGAPGGRTLMGELGAEIYVDPTTNKWYKVGEHGAEFVDLPAGAIVFNAKQTRRLLSNGSTPDRGDAMLSGNAAANTFFSNPITRITQIQKSVTGNLSNWLNRSQSESRKAPSNSNKAYNNSKDDANKAKDDAKDLFDWIEVAIARVERAISNLSRTASSAFKTLSTRLSATDKEIKKVNKEIDIQQKGAKRYLQEANSVDLSDDLKKRVQTGAIDINEYDDDVKEKIQNYQNWYEKFLACKDAAKELHETLAGLYTGKFDTIEKDFDNKLSSVEHRMAMFQKSLEKSDYTGASKPFVKMINAQTSAMTIQQKELKRLKKAQKEAVASGEVEKGSEAWYDMQKAINSVEESIEESSIKIASLYKDAFDAISEEFSDKMSVVENQMTAYNNAISDAEYTGTSKPFDDMIKTQRSGIKTLKSELSSLQKSMNAAVASGKIKEGSKEWYEMQNAIKAVEATIAETTTLIRKTYKDIFDDIERRYKNIQGLNDHTLAQINQSIQAADYTAGIRPFGDAIKTQLKNLGSMQSELADLKAQMKAAVDAKDGIKKGSDAWYEMKNAVESTKESIRSLTLEIAKNFVNIFSDIKQQYENTMSLADNAKNYLSKVQTASDYTGQSKAFDSMMQIEKQSTKTLNKELAALEEALQTALDSGVVTEYSKEWYDMVAQISNVKSKLQDSAINMAKIYEDAFNEVQSQYGDIIGMSDSLSKVFEAMASASDYSGNVKPFGEMIGLNETNVEMYKSELAALEKARDDAVNSGKIAEGSKKWYEMQDAIDGVKVKLIETAVATSKLYKDAFDDVEARFGNVTTLIGHGITQLNNEVTATTYNGNAKPFMNLVDLQRENAAVLEEELISLQKKLDEAVDSGHIAEGSSEWYEMVSAIQTVRENLQETRIEVSKLYKDMFDDVEQRYDKTVSLLGRIGETMQTGLEEIEARGYLGGTELYRQMSEIQAKSIDAQKEELAGLQNAMAEAINSGEIAEGSDAWYEMQESILSVNDSISKGTIELLNYAKAMRQIEWEKFDRTQEDIQAIIDESEFLIELMNSSERFDDRGQPTGTGKSQIGLHAMDYDIYMAKADDYAAEIKRLSAEIARDPANNDLIERRNELLKLQRDSILAAEQEKEAVRDLVEEGINKELDSLNELISTYEENLEASKDLYDYQKNIAQQTKEIATLQKQLSAYQGDNSEENRARLQRIQVDLTDAMEKLEETQYERYISDQKKLLDDMYDEYSKILNARLDNIDLLMNEMIDYTNQNAADISSTITKECAAVGAGISTSLSTIWEEGGAAASVVSQYGATMGTIGTALDDVKNNVASMYEAVGSIVTDYTEKSEATKTALDTLTGADGVKGVMDAISGPNGVKDILDKINGTDGVKGAVDALNGENGIRGAVATAAEGTKAGIEALGTKADGLKTAVESIGSILELGGMNSDNKSGKELDSDVESNVSEMVSEIKESIKVSNKNAKTQNNTLTEVAEHLKEVTDALQAMSPTSTSGNGKETSDYKQKSKNAQKEYDALEKNLGKKVRSGKASKKEVAEYQAQSQALLYGLNEESWSNADKKTQEKVQAIKDSLVKTNQSITLRDDIAKLEKRLKNADAAVNEAYSAVEKAEHDARDAEKQWKTTRSITDRDKYDGAMNVRQRAILSLESLTSQRKTIEEQLKKARESLKALTGYSAGGFVADLQKVASHNGDDIVTLNTLKRGEAVLTPEQAERFKLLVQSLPQLQNAIDMSSQLDDLRAIDSMVRSARSNVNVGGITVTIPIDHVDDYNDFVRKLRDDRTFERMIQTMTVDPLVGKSTLLKKKYYN